MQFRVGGESKVGGGGGVDAASVAQGQKMSCFRLAPFNCNKSEEGETIAFRLFFH